MKESPCELSHAISSLIRIRPDQAQTLTHMTILSHLTHMTLLINLTLLILLTHLIRITKLPVMTPFSHTWRILGHTSTHPDLILAVFSKWMKSVRSQNVPAESSIRKQFWIRKLFPPKIWKIFRKSENLKILWAKRFYVLVIFYLMFAFKRRRPCHELNFMVWQSSVV